ncbi:MAG TPA: hypothetical protein VK463_07600 [Desulfomonilaceae bacterium]|nr:hypothetical protein [Desulfomonilaceae bacterium]
MNKLLVLAFIVVLFGCSSVRNNPDVVEVPDDVWQRVKKQTEERRKKEEANKKTIETQELEKLNKALEQAKPDRKRKD